MTFEDIKRAAAAVHLVPLGGFYKDGITTVLLGPLEPGFWAFVTQQPEFVGDHPLDAWSSATISNLARSLKGDAVFPFGGPPYHPFIAWALRSGESWSSPVGLLVHKEAGLLVSYRGALQFEGQIELPVAARSPCGTCIDKPCLSACPVSALGVEGYDVPNCKDNIDADAVCRSGCRVRLACPISQTYSRDPAQTAFHMKAFHPL